MLTLVFLAGGFLALYFTVLRPSDDSGAFSSSSESSYQLVWELLNDPTDATGDTPFNRQNLKTLVNMLANQSGDLSTQVASLKERASSEPITATDLRQYSYNKSQNQSIVVRLGGLDWIVTYVSVTEADESGNQDLVATLWLSSDVQEKWKSEEDISVDYGAYVISDGAIKSRWSANWSGSNPGNMYSTSYIHLVTLNNGGVYVTTSGTYEEIGQNASNPFALYTLDSKGLNTYIVKPNQLAWTSGESARTQLGWGYNASNDSLTGTGDYHSVYDYSSSDYPTRAATYANWGYDDLWIPSVVEVGQSDNSTKAQGLWAMNNDERSASTYTFTRSAYVDNGYGCYVIKADGNGTQQGSVSSKQAVRPALNLNLTKAISASSSPSTSTTLTLNLNNESGDTTNISITAGDPMPSAVDIPSRNGCIFLGYYSTNNKNGKMMYDSAGNLAMSLMYLSDDLTLYALWNVSVVFDPCNGNSTTTLYLYTGDPPDSVTVPTLSKYNFMGYFTEQNGLGTKCFNADGTGIANAITKPTKVYASWLGGTYTIKYNSNGGSGTMANSTHTFGSSQRLTANAFIKEGYVFSGWDTSSYGTTVVYTNGQYVGDLTSTISETVNLYAVWAEITTSFVVIYDANGGEGTTASSVHTTSTPKSLTPNGFTKTGYRFLGWSTDQNATTPEYVDEGVYTSDLTEGSITLYAVWDKYCVLKLTASIRDAVGVLTGDGDDGYFVKGSTTTLTAYPKQSYRFSYWLKDGEEFEGNESNILTVTITEDVLYTAVFDTAGVNIEEFSVASTYGGVAYVVGQKTDLSDTDTVTVATKLTVVGYQFIGWYVDKDRTTCLSTNTSFRVEKPVAYKHILVAVYEPVSNSNLNMQLDNMSSE